MEYMNFGKWNQCETMPEAATRQEGARDNHKYMGSQQFSRVDYSTQIYRFDTRGAKEYLKVLAVELPIQPYLEINYLQQYDQ